MTKNEVLLKISYYQDKLKEYQNIYDKMTAVFEIKDMKKPFYKYDISEMSALNDISEKAFAWSRKAENREKNIYDYNAEAPKDERIDLAR